MAYPIDADDIAELSGTAGLDTRERVFEHDCLRRFYTQGVRSSEVGIWSWFSCKMFGGCDIAIDSRIEQIRDSCRGEHLFTMLAGRYYGRS
jgi:hypothetical protein